jgi:hypothetical protein
MVVCQDGSLLEAKMPFCSLSCCQLHLFHLKMAVSKFESQVLNYQESLNLRRSDTVHVLGTVNANHVLPNERIVPTEPAMDHFAHAVPNIDRFAPEVPTIYRFAPAINPFAPEVPEIDQFAPAVPVIERFVPAINHFAAEVPAIDQFAPAVPLGGQDKRVIRNSYTVEQKQKIIAELVGSNNIKAKCCLLSKTNGISEATMMKWYLVRDIINGVTKSSEKKKKRMGNPGRLQDEDFEQDVLEHIRYEQEHEHYVSTSTVLQHMQENWPVFWDWWFNNQENKLDSLRKQII